MLPNKLDKVHSKMKGSNPKRKDAASSFFRQDGGSFFRQDKNSSKRTVKNAKSAPNKNSAPVINTDASKLHTPVSFETRDRLVSSVQSYMALFCSLGDAGMSLSTSVHSVLSEIGFTEIAGQFSKGFNDINDISMVTFDEMKNFVERVVEAWENSTDGKSLTVQSVLQVLAYLLKTQLNFLRVASEHISEVLNTQYSGRTMLELLGGEEFFLTPPSTPTKASLADACSSNTATSISAEPTCSSAQKKEVPSSCVKANKPASASTKSDSQAIVPEKTKSTGVKKPTDSSLSTSASTSKTTSDENLSYTPPTDKEITSVIDLLSGSRLSKNTNQSNVKPRPSPQPTNPGVATSISTQYAPFLYPTAANVYPLSMAYLISSQAPTSQPMFLPANYAFPHVFKPPPSSMPPGHDLTSQLFSYYMAQGLEPSLASVYAENPMLMSQATTLQQQQEHYRSQSIQESSMQAPRNFNNMTLDDNSLSNVDRPHVSRTHTWPMRPEKSDYDYTGLPVSQSFEPGTSAAVGDDSVDLEFNQYVNAMQRWRISGQAVSSLDGTRGSSTGVGSANRGVVDNPWSVGDSAMAWPPHLNISDSTEAKQWVEDSSNCSDESSSNQGGDWGAVAEPLARGQLLAAKKAFHKAALNEPHLTRKWPLKQATPRDTVTEFDPTSQLFAHGTTAHVGLDASELGVCGGGGGGGVFEGGESSMESGLLRHQLGLLTGEAGSRGIPGQSPGKNFISNSWTAVQY